MIKVSFQGEFGAYGEIAAHKFFGKEIEVMPCQTFSDLFDRVSDSTADFGIAPAVTGLLKRAAFVKILGSYRAAE